MPKRENKAKQVYDSLSVTISTVELQMLGHFAVCCSTKHVTNVRNGAELLFSWLSSTLSLKST